MSSPFLSSLNCRQINKQTFMKENKASRVSPSQNFISKPSKIVYSLRQKKYVLKQQHTMTAIMSVRKRSKENDEQKQNLNQLPIPKPVKKPFQIQQQLNISILPYNASQNPSPFSSLIIKLKPMHSSHESCNKYDNLRSTQETQLCGAQLGERINNNYKIAGRKLSGSGGKQYQCEGRFNVGSGPAVLLKRKIEQSLLNLADSGNYSHPSMFVQNSDKPPVHKLKKQKAQQPSHSHSLAINPNHELNLREPLTMKKISNNSSTFVTHASNLPSTISKMGSKLHRLNQLSIRSTQSIKEEESNVEEFSQVLVQSPKILGKRKVSLFQRRQKVQR